MTHRVTKDRDYYRCCSNKRLIEEAKHDPNPELAVALAERLEEARRMTHHNIDRLDRD
jgi:hypothetical protein